MKYSKYFLVIAAFLIVVTFNISNCYAVENSPNIERASLIDDIFKSGNDFYNNSQKAGKSEDSGGNKSLGTNIADYIKEPGGIIDMIRAAGNLVFAVITVCLGAKYIWSGVEGKSQVKETLPAFLIGVIMFYLADNLYSLFSGAANEIIVGKANFDSVAGSIRATINAVVRVAAMVGIVFIGLKYMFSNANDKASIKDRLVPLVIGIVLVYSASTVVDFIVTAGQKIIS